MRLNSCEKNVKSSKKKKKTQKKNFNIIYLFIINDPGGNGNMDLHKI